MCTYKEQSNRKLATIAMQSVTGIQVRTASSTVCYGQGEGVITPSYPSVSAALEQKESELLHLRHNAILELEAQVHLA